MDHKKVRTFTATSQDLEMLEAIARYHGFSKSATITSLIRKEFWRVLPAGNRSIRPDRGARIIGKSDDRRGGAAGRVPARPGGVAAA